MARLDLFFLRCWRVLVNFVWEGQGADVKFCMGVFGIWLEKPTSAYASGSASSDNSSCSNPLHIPAIADVEEDTLEDVIPTHF